ncbi:MAG: glycosyltransferase family 39 protein [Candidatus Pacebacteria bacterium]|nr:glycosyltransferase family 39 protein [Candidatus Paceibacterota bacterium]
MLSFFNKNLFIALSILVLVFAAGLRLYKLADVPHGMTWDEAAIGYNGYAILTTRRDEWIFKLPVSFRSFGDYKAPFAIYLNGLFTFLFGLNLWAVRLPFVLVGIGSVLGMILLTKELGIKIGWQKKQIFWLSLISGILLSISPWHLHYSRTGFESGMALGFTVWGAFLLLRAYNKDKLNWFSLYSSVFFFVLTLYTYHSSKIVTPLLVLSILLWNKDKVFKYFKHLLLAGISGLVILYPLIKDSIYGKGLERAGTLIFNQSDSTVEVVVTFIKQLFAHLTPSFLVLGETTSFRHGDGKWGVLLPITYFLVLTGLVFFIKKIRSGKIDKNYLFIFFWIFIGIIPAALGAELVPHSNRALLALPGFLLLAIYGLNDLSSWLKATKLNKQIPGSHGAKNMVWVSVMGIMIFLQTLFFIKYINNYYSDFAKISANDFTDGYLEAFDYVKEFEKDKEKIVFTSEYGQPYIYALFSRKTNPIWYQGGSLIKYEFKEVNVGDLERQNAVIVAGKSSEFIEASRADKVIYGSDGEVRFKIFIR